MKKIGNIIYQKYVFNLYFGDNYDAKVMKKELRLFLCHLQSAYSFNRYNSKHITIYIFIIIYIFNHMLS